MFGKYVTIGISIVATAIAAIAGVISLLQGVLCILSNVVMCTLEKLGVADVASVGPCFAAAGACWQAILTAAVAITAAFGVASPGLQRMKVGPFERKDQPASQAKV